MEKLKFLFVISFIFIGACSTMVDKYKDDNPSNINLSNLPEKITKVRSVSIRVSGEELVAYKYKLNDSVWSEAQNIDQEITLNDLEDAEYTLSVIGSNPYRVWSENPKKFSWQVDNLPPQIDLNNAPANPTNILSVNATIANQDVTHYCYRLDGGAWSSELSKDVPITAGNLAPGSHVLEIVGLDTAGNWQSKTTPTEFAWEIDTTSPVVALLNRPAPKTNITTYEMTIANSDVSHYRYRLNGGAWSDVYEKETPITGTNLVDESYSLEVIGQDTAGNWQLESAPSIVNWVVDTVPPVAELADLPPSVSIPERTEIDVRGADVVAFRYSVNGGAYGTERTSYNDISVIPSAGTYQIAVIGKDSAGNWQSMDNPTTYSWEVVGEYFVAVGYGYGYYSIDGINWIHDVNVSRQVAVAYGNGIFVSVGHEKYSRSSSGGINWGYTAVEGWTTNSSTTGDLVYKDIIYANGRFVAVGAFGWRAVSTTGTSWTFYPGAGNSSGNSSYDLNAIAYGNGIYVAVGANSGNYISTDTVNWTGISPGRTSYAIVFGNGRFVAVGYNGMNMSSINGSSWTINTSVGGTLNAIAYGNGRFVAVGDNGRRIISTNGVTWTNEITGGSNLHGITYGKGIFVAVGENNTRMISTNGVTWTNVVSESSSTLYDVVYRSE